MNATTICDPCRSMDRIGMQDVEESCSFHKTYVKQNVSRPFMISRDLQYEILISESRPASIRSDACAYDSWQKRDLSTRNLHHLLCTIVYMHACVVASFRAWLGQGIRWCKQRVLDVCRIWYMMHACSLDLIGWLDWTIYLGERKANDFMTSWAIDSCRYMPKLERCHHASSSS